MEVPNNGTHPLVGARRAVAPGLELGRDALLGEVQRLPPEHAPGERETVEGAEAVERIEAVSSDMRN